MRKREIQATIFFIFINIFLIGLSSAGDSLYIQQGIDNAEGGLFQVPAGTYYIDKGINVKEGVTIKGTVSESGELLTHFILDPSLKLGEQEPVFKILKGHNDISYIHWHGNSEDRPTVPYWRGHRGDQPPMKTGQGYDNFIGGQHFENVSVHDNIFEDNLGDFFRPTNSKYIKFYNNKGYMCGHDAFYAIRCEYVLCYNNYIEPRVNSAVRFMDVSHGAVYGNVINFNRDSAGGRLSAGPALQFQNDNGDMKDIEIYGNYVYNSWGPDIWLVGKTKNTEQEIHIHHNVFMNGGGNHGIYWVGGIIASGFDGALIENNVWDGAHLASISFWAYSKSWALPATAKIQNNIFTNSQPGGKSPSGGWGINNEIPAQTVISEYNTYFNNAAGNTRGCSVSSTDLFVDPKKENVPCGISWDGSKWVIPNMPAPDLGEIEDLYDDLPDITPEEEREFEFNSLFDILDFEFFDTGHTQQTEDQVTIKIEERNKGKIRGGIVIAGFGDVVYKNDIPYIPDNDSVIVKAIAIPSPVYSFSGIRGIEKQIDKGIEDGEAYAKMTVTMRYIVKVKNPEGGEKVKKVKKTTAVFEAEPVPAPALLPRPGKIFFKIDQYIGGVNNYTTVTPITASEGLQRIEYEYDGKKVKHVFEVGERSKNDRGIIHTNITEVDYWDGDLDNLGEGLYIEGEDFDQDKLKIRAYTIYEEVPTETDFELHEYTAQRLLSFDNIITLLKIVVVLFAIYQLLKMLF